MDSERESLDEIYEFNEICFEQYSLSSTAMDLICSRDQIILIYVKNSSPLKDSLGKKVDLEEFKDVFYKYEDWKRIVDHFKWRLNANHYIFDLNLDINIPLEEQGYLALVSPLELFSLMSNGSFHYSNQNWISRKWSIMILSSSYSPSSNEVSKINELIYFLNELNFFKVLDFRISFQVSEYYFKELSKFKFMIPKDNNLKHFVILSHHTTSEDFSFYTGSTKKGEYFKENYIVNDSKTIESRNIIGINEALLLYNDYYRSILKIFKKRILEQESNSTRMNNSIVTASFVSNLLFALQFTVIFTILLPYKWYLNLIIVQILQFIMYRLIMFFKRVV
jgi:hypothetical protein